MNASSTLPALLPFHIQLWNGGLQHFSFPGHQSGHPSICSPLWKYTDDAQYVATAIELFIYLFILLAAETECDSQSLQTSQAQGLRTLPSWGHYMYLQDETMSGIKSHEGKIWQFIIVRLPKGIYIKYIWNTQTDFFQQNFILPIMHQTEDLSKLWTAH